MGATIIYAFELRMTRSLSSSQTLYIMNVKDEVVEIKRIVIELYDRPVMSNLKVTTVMLDVHIDNICAISELVV